MSIIQKSARLSRSLLRQAKRRASHKDFKKRQEWVRSLLRCPQCRAKQLFFTKDEVRCESCARTYRVIADCCVFHDDSAVSRVNYRREDFGIPSKFIEMIQKSGGFGLNIGSGAQQNNNDFIIDFDYVLCPTTDVVGDAHLLPFNDGQFNSVLSLNVFEHLNNPNRAVEEIQRVCTKGGLLIIRTAFMQPQHDFHHYFNATRDGVREWFSPYFKETSCTVSPNFTIEKTMAWIAHDFLKMIRKYCSINTIQRYENLNLKELEEIWKNIHSSEYEELLKMIKDIPDEAQGELALGFEFVGEKK